MARTIIVTIPDGKQRAYSADTFLTDVGDGFLTVFGEKNTSIAIYAPGQWQSVHYAEDEITNDGSR